ncbi:chemotaxis protein CheB [Nocardia yunnanensis]|uniref:protein-glutamate methylesterase n=1 Tax=Nocardia yunnanensis TaxID=2382165 RepID=A0A386ZBR0_9NOCA|nr:chemotaxis protein CheB [Nocardia yunnanensis]AYF75060.1 chemotaxis protein CheB [Nocardia yunnanensis]
MEPTDLIAVGASAGGVEALREFVSGLPDDLPAAVLVVLHMPARGTSALAAILARAGKLPVEPASNGGKLQAGHIYTAVPDTHLLLRDGRMVLSHGPTENGHRPGVDATFRSAAVAWGPNATGIVLSGALDDGTAGLALIKRRGGLAVVQDPEEALYQGMPESALRHVAVDMVLPARDIGPAVAAKLQSRGVTAVPPLSGLDRLEADIDAGHRIDRNGVASMSVPSGYTCPDCDGSLYPLEDGLRYRCRVGHAWTAEALLTEQGIQVEKALWTALRALQEKRQLAERMCADAKRFGDETLSKRFADQAAEHRGAAEILRKLLVGTGKDEPA